MGIYDVLKDGVKVARNAGNIELSIELAKVADDLLEKQKRIKELEDKVQKLEEIKKLEFAEGENYLVDPNHPTRKLCPVCSKKHMIQVPLDGEYCRQCKGYYG